MKTTGESKQQNVISLLLVILFSYPGLVSAECVETLQSQYANIGAGVTLNFAVNIGTIKSGTTTITAKSGNTTMMTVVYKKNTENIVANMDASLVTFTGDEKNGNLSFMITNAKEKHAGIYRLISDATTVLQCLTIYILGKPKMPSIKQYELGAEVGSSVTFECFSESGTLPQDHNLGMSYNWTVGIAVNPSESRYSYSATRSKLTISAVNRADHNTGVSCLAREMVTGGQTSDMSAPVSINVFYGPEKERFQPPYTNYTHNERHVLNTILCLADCNPVCKFRWNKDGNQHTDGASLSLGSLNSSDAGEYSCIATRGSSSGTKYLTVNVIYGPKTIILSPEKSLYEGNENDTLLIKCSAECYPPCTYTWTKVRTISILSFSQALEFSSLTRDDKGDYVCTVSNEEVEMPNRNQINRTVKIVVRYGPDNIIIMPDGPFSVEERHIIPNFTCSSKCYPGCSQMWNIVPGTVEIGKGNVLSLGTAFRNYTSEYKCTSTNNAMEFNQTLARSINIIVRYHPDVTITQINGTNFTEGSQNILLLCSAQGEPTNYTFTNWIHYAPDGYTKIRELEPSMADQDEVYLKFQFASYMDSGSYKCNVSNGVPKFGTKDVFAYETVTQLIKGPPVIIEEKKDIASALHENASLSVTFYNNDDTTPTINWYRTENETLKNEDNKMFFARSGENVSVDFHSVNVVLPGYKIELHIQNISQSDLGVYNVSVSNSIGTSVLTINLHAQGVPEPPEDFAIDSITLSSVVLTWRCGFHSGANQTFFIQYNTTSSPWQTKASVDGGQLENTDFNATIYELSPETQYSFRIFAANKYGNSSFSKDTLTITTDTLATEKPESSSDGLIGAAVGSGIGGAVVIIGSVVLIIILRRRASKKRTSAGTQKKTLLNGNKRQRNEDELTEVQNPVYETADPSPSASQATYVYSQVSKPKKKQPNIETTEKNDIYAQVQKTQKMDISGKEKKEKKGKENPAKKSKQGKRKGGLNGKDNGGLVYENAETLKSTTDSFGNVYELTDDSSNSSRPTRTQNQDGLIYVEVDHPPLKDNTDRKAIIHGIDDRSEYADIAFGKVGELAPESDEDEKKE